MVYLINLILSVSYFYILRKVKKIDFFTVFPMILIWILIIGGQYDVGTDYQHYLNYFYGKRDIAVFYRNREYLFYLLIKKLGELTTNGQSLFLVIGLLESFLLVFIIKKITEIKLIKKKEIYIFIFLFFCQGTLFYNQLNILRQGVAIYFFSIGVFLFIEKKYKRAILIFLIGALFHISLLIAVIIFLGILFLLNIDSKNKFILLFIVLCSLSLLDLEIIIKKIASYTKYKGYINSVFFVEQHIKNKIVKYMYIPIYMLSFKCFNHQVGVRKKILKLGLLFVAFRLTFLNIRIISRIGEYFGIITIFPIFYLIENLKQKKEKSILLCIIFFVLCIFLIKVMIFPRNEYLYRSYLLN